MSAQQFQVLVLPYSDRTIHGQEYEQLPFQESINDLNQRHDR